MTDTNRPRQTTEQRRAAHAWSVIELIRAARDDKGRPKYLSSNQKGEPIATEAGKKLGTEMKKLPTRIIAAGLGQALAFVHAKEAATVVEQALTDWLKHRPESFDADRTPAKTGCGPLLDEIVHRWSASKLRQQTEEALQYLPWLSRFAEAAGLMEKEKEHA
jgi:CRISPR-associated protein Cmr5